MNRRSVIVLVEDSDDDAELTLRALRRNQVGNEVVRLVDGVEALDFFCATGAYQDRDAGDLPELILLDLKLPRRSGLEVLEWLKADDRYKEVPVVVLTSSIEQRDLEKAYALGVNSYVQKPVEFAEFTECVAQIGMYWLLVNRPPTTLS
jgi:CheY-like chemotaxis protein